MSLRPDQQPTTRRITILTAALSACLLLGWAGSAAAQSLTIGPLSAPLVGGRTCPGDSDGDCLDDALEDELADLAAPVLFYDEDESCTAGIGGDPEHYPRQDFAQVRPSGWGVRDWPNESGGHTITIHYYFLYPHDCQHCFGIGGHQGDVERVSYTLRSNDLLTWTITGGVYRHHGTDPTNANGQQLGAVAARLGVSRPVVAVSQNSHASYITWAFLSEFLFLNSSGCGPDTSGLNVGLFTVCVDDCYCDSTNASLATCFAAGATDGLFEIATPQNLGEPERLRTDGTLKSEPDPNSQRPFVFTELDLGHGLNREFWSENVPGPEFAYFCGWECAAKDRPDDKAKCDTSAHGDRKCIGQLFGYLDDAHFDLEPAPPIVPWSDEYPHCDDDNDCLAGEECQRGLCTPW